VFGWGGEVIMLMVRIPNKIGQEQESRTRVHEVGNAIV
jgi:hypothetical protein